MYYDWVEGNICTSLPLTAVWCCNDQDGSDVYIGKCIVENSLLAVKIVPRRKEAYAAYKGKEIPVANFKVLISHTKEPNIWIRSFNGEIPHNAVVCGYDRYNKLYVGKTYHNGYCVPGYIYPENRCIHVSWGGKEFKYSEYEVLVNSLT